MPARSKVDTLPEEVRRWLDQALTENNFSGYRELEALMREKGYQIGRSQIARYGQKVQRRFAAIREATEIARIITEGAQDDLDNRSEAIIATIQSDILAALVDVREAENEIDPVKKAALLAKMGHSVALMANSSVSLKKYRADVKQRTEAAASKAEKIGCTGGLSAQAVQELRRQILGIAE